MKTKYYVIPVDSEGYGYLGVKSEINPYTRSSSYYCAGCPQFFGGNDLGDIYTTLRREAIQESRMQLHIYDYDDKTIHHYSNSELEMYFYVSRMFAITPEFRASNEFVSTHPEYRETTGEIFKFRLGEINVDNDNATGESIFGIYERTFQRAIKSEHKSSFLSSETVKALRAVVKAFR